MNLRRLGAALLAAALLAAACSAHATERSLGGASSPTTTTTPSVNVDVVGLQLFPTTYSGSYLDGEQTVLLFTVDPQSPASTLAQRLKLTDYRGMQVNFSLAQLQAAAQTLGSPSVAQAGVEAVAVDVRANRVDLTAASEAAATRLLTLVDRRLVTTTIGTAAVTGS